MGNKRVKEPCPETHQGGFCLARRSKIAILCSMVISLCAPLGLPAYANTLAQDQALVAQLKQEANQTYAQIATEKAKASSLQNQAAVYQRALLNVEQGMHMNQVQTIAVERKITELTMEIHKNQVTLNTDKVELTGQLRAMYEQGPMQYLTVLFGSKSFHDFLSRLSLLEIVAQKQHQMILQVQSLERSIKTQKGVQQKQYATLLVKHQQLHSFQSAQQVLLHKNQVLQAAVKSNIQSETRRNVLVESQIKLTQQQIQQIQQETQKAEQLMQNSTYVAQQQSQLANVSASSIISFAEQFMGTPYVWGGTSPSGFDCSGFVQYVFAHFGVQLNRTSEQQFAEGVPVATSNLKPGDLVFFSTYAPGATHVGIYMGNGMMIDSEDLGVTIDSMFNSYWGPKYIGARQVLQ